MRIINFIKKIYSDYFEYFSEADTTKCTEQNPAFYIYYYVGRKRRNLVGKQYCY